MKTSSSWRAWRPLACAAALFGLAPASLQHAGEAQSLEYPVKAAFLLNFARFTEWPEGSPQASAAKVSICLLGHDPFGGSLDRVVAGRAAGGRPVEVRRHQEPAGVESCHVLFVTAANMARMPTLLERLREKPVLTVGESEDFIGRGGQIRFFVENDRARFEVSLAATELGRLTLSSKLLGVARVLAARPAAER